MDFREVSRDVRVSVEEVRVVDTLESEERFDDSTVDLRSVPGTVFYQ